jgi:hypothetical protein
MAYFLLGYEDFNNPIPIMEKMFEIDPDSEILKVMAVRSINELERNYLPIYYYTNNNEKSAVKVSANTTADQPKTEVAEAPKEEKISFWQKIVRFFKNYSELKIKRVLK